MSIERHHEFLSSIADIDRFIRSLFFDDDLEDWTLARDYGQLLTRIGPDLLVGHVVLARSYRHLGELENAAGAVERCRALIAGGNIASGEIEVLLPILTAEEQHLSSEESGT